MNNISSEADVFTDIISIETLSFTLESNKDLTLAAKQVSIFDIIFEAKYNFLKYKVLPKQKYTLTAYYTKK